MVQAELTDLAIKWQNGLSAYNFTVAIHHHKKNTLVVVRSKQSDRRKAISPRSSAEDRCFTSVIGRKEPKFVEFLQLLDTLENPILPNAS